MKIYDFVPYKSHDLSFLCYDLDGFQPSPQCPKLPFISLIKELQGPEVLPCDHGAKGVPCPFWSSAHLEFLLLFVVIKT